jgi:oligopeptide transport system substrate-binding protein
VLAGILCQISLTPAIIKDSTRRPAIVVGHRPSAPGIAGRTKSAGLRATLPSHAVFRFVFVVLLLLLTACGSEQNDPYPRAERGRNILYSAFTERPKHLDPVQSYSEDEITFTAQIYEPPLQYHYLKRPYTLIPLTSEAVPVPRYYDEQGHELPADAPVAAIAHSVYEIRIRPGIRYQPHPAFAVDAGGQPLYRDLDREALRGIEKIADFAQTGTRELIADDYIYQIKRLAHPRLHSPIFSMMAERIVGLRELGAACRRRPGPCRPAPGWISIACPLGRGEPRRSLHLSHQAARQVSTVRLLAGDALLRPGATRGRPLLPSARDGREEPDARLVSGGHWSLHADAERPQQPHDSRTQSELPRRDLSLPRRARRPGGRLLADCGKPLPFIEQAIFSREKESIPYWNKFLQGYYDASGISSDSFDQAVRLGVGGDVQLTDEMRDKGIRLLTSVRASIFYMGFNMLDPVVGGLAEQPTKLRQALSMVIDQEEFISIFMNGRGIAATSPLPPGIFGYLEGKEGSNPVVYDWVDGRPQRKPVAEAKKLLAEAGWPNGRHATSGEPLVLNLDTTTGGMGEKSRLDWLTRQFAKLDIQLVVRSTDFNRFQEKVRKGAVQLYYLGWNADYPDPENFLFLLAGPEGKVAKGGENASNYANPSSTGSSSR